LPWDGIERLSWRHRARAPVPPGEEADRAFNDDRCGHGVDVAAGAGDAAPVRSPTHDDVHHELLSRASSVVGGGRRRSGDVVGVVERRGVEVGAELADVENPVSSR